MPLNNNVPPDLRPSNRTQDTHRQHDRLSPAKTAFLFIAIAVGYALLLGPHLTGRDAPDHAAMPVTAPLPTASEPAKGRSG